MTWNSESRVTVNLLRYNTPVYCTRLLLFRLKQCLFLFGLVAKCLRLQFLQLCEEGKKIVLYIIYIH